MSRGKHLSLEEARKLKQLEQFAKEHPREGDKEAFDKLLKSMASGKPPAKRRTSGGDSSGD
jgi:hypothetical protein